MKQAKGERNRKKYLIDLTESNPLIIEPVIKEFEYLAQNRGILTIKENGYVLKRNRFQAKKEGDLAVSHPTVKKFADYMFYLKNYQIQSAKEVNLLFPESFCKCWKLATNNTWEFWVEKHINRALLEPKKIQPKSSQPHFDNGIDLIEKAASCGILNSESPAFFIGAFCSYIWAEHKKELLSFVLNNQYQVRILGQNPYSKRASDIAEELDTDIDTFIRIKKKCLDLESKAPHLIRVNFDYDINDYYFSGVFSETNKYNISYKVFLNKKLTKEETGTYEIKQNEYLRVYGNIFQRIKDLYHEGAWKLPVRECVK